jgi:hypothetical protein
VNQKRAKLMKKEGGQKKKTNKAQKNLIQKREKTP